VRVRGAVSKTAHVRSRPRQRCSGRRGQSNDGKGRLRQRGCGHRAVYAREQALGDRRSGGGADHRRLRCRAESGLGILHPRPECGGARQRLRRVDRGCRRHQLHVLQRCRAYAPGRKSSCVRGELDPDRRQVSRRRCDYGGGDLDRGGRGRPKQRGSSNSPRAVRPLGSFGQLRGDSQAVSRGGHQRAIRVRNRLRRWMGRALLRAAIAVAVSRYQSHGSIRGCPRSFPRCRFASAIHGREA
jgi:hypothetical protein